MGRTKKQTGKSLTKRSKTIKHLQRTYLPRASEDPNRKHKIADKVIDHKTEDLHVWYLIRFKDMAKPQWLPENSISGCKQLIREYWIRENAMSNATNTDDNYTDQDEFQSLRYSPNSDDSKYDKSQSSHVQYSAISHRGRPSSCSRGESFLRSNFQYRSESCDTYDESDAESHSYNSVTSAKIQKNYSEQPGDQVLRKPQSKVVNNQTTNKSATQSESYEENRQVFSPKAVSKTSSERLLSKPNIATPRAPIVIEPTLTKGKNKTIGLDVKRSRSEDLVAQLQQPLDFTDIERMQLQGKDKIRPKMRIPQESTSSSIQSHVENNGLSGTPSKASISSNIKWSGNIIKGSLVLFVASVNVTPFPGRCDNITTLEKIMNEKVPKLCIQHSLPLSYALSLVKDKYSMFEINPLQTIKSRHGVSVEKTIMMRSKIAGVIWIEEYKTGWIIFPYHERICRILKLPDKKELKLFAVSISVPSTFDPFPLNSEPEEPPILPNADRFSVEEIIKTKIFLKQTGYYSELLEICKDRIHFTYFGNEEFQDVQELLLAMKVLGAICERNYSENISFVFVHIFFLKQLLFMRNFMDFKKLSNCRFLIFGTDLKESPEQFHFREHLPKGGIVSVTTYTFLQEEQVSSRIMNVIDHQLTTQNAPWDYLLYVNVTDNLADIGQNQNNQHALRAWHETMAAIGTKKARYMKEEEIFMPILEEPSPMISSLYRTMLRIHTMYAAERRDFILIRHIEEEELANEPIPGVWKMSLQEFEQTFGQTKQ